MRLFGDDVRGRRNGEVSQDVGSCGGQYRHKLLSNGDTCPSGREEDALEHCYNGEIEYLQPQKLINRSIESR